MAAPPSQGSSPWSEDLPADTACNGPHPDRQPGEGPATRSPMTWQPAMVRATATPWLWLPTALSSMLLVLFAVVIHRQQEQAHRLGDLQSRVQTLEHSRALERTAVLEQQLRSMLTRLQNQEKLTRQQEQQAQQLQTLQQELQQLRGRVGPSLTPLEQPLSPLPRPPRAPRPDAEPPDSP